MIHRQLEEWNRLDDPGYMPDSPEANHVGKAGFKRDVVPAESHHVWIPPFVGSAERCHQIGRSTCDLVTTV